MKSLKQTTKRKQNKMTKNEAKAFILKGNPNAVFKEDKYGDFEAFDFTYTSEFRTMLYYFDSGMFLYDASNDEEIIL